MTFVDEHATERGGPVDRRQIPSDWCERVPEYCALLEAGNGIAFAGGLWRLFGVGAGRIGRDAREWNRAPWRAAYQMPPTLLLVGENVFGDQLGVDLESGVIVKVDCEGGNIGRLPFASLSACVAELVSSPSEDDLYLFDAGRKAGLRPTLLEHLSFSLPLISGGSPSDDNLEVLDGEAHLELLGQIMEQTRGVPEGTPIKKFTPT